MGVFASGESGSPRRRVSDDLFQHARMPMLQLDESGTVVGANVCLRILFGVDVAGCKGRHFSFLIDRLCENITGAFFPFAGVARSHLSQINRQSRKAISLSTEELGPMVTECCYESTAFGRTSLRVCELPSIDSVTGNCVGSTLSIEVVEIADPVAFRNAIDSHLSHEIMWQVYAASYDRILPVLPFYCEVLERHSDTFRPTQFQTILDIGAGTGTLTVQLLDRGKRVTAVDVCQPMLARLREKTSAVDKGRISIVEDTAEYMPYFQDESFDGVNVLLAFFDMDDPLAALSEAVRVLRPGGTIAVTEPRECFNVDLLMAAAEQDLRKKRVFEELAEDWARINVIAPLIRNRIKKTQEHGASSLEKNTWSAELLFECLQQRGYHDLSFRESHLGNCATIVGTKPS